MIRPSLSIIFKGLSRTIYKILTHLIIKGTARKLEKIIKTATDMIKKWFYYHFSSFFESVLPENSKSCPADHQRGHQRTSNLIKSLTEMIEKWFDHHFSSFFQGYSLRHKKSALTLAVDQRTWRFFSKICKKKLSKSTAPRKYKIIWLRGQSHSLLIIKGTFRHEKRILRFVINMIDKLFDHHFSSFFQGYSLWHRKISLDLGGESKNMKIFFKNF